MKKHICLGILASLVCCTLQATTYYVTQSTEPGNEDLSSCTTCTSSTNTCCTFLTALNQVQWATDTNTIITMPSEITYTGPLEELGNLVTYQCTIQSGLDSGTVINFDNQTSYAGYIFQPTSQVSGDPIYISSYILDNVVFQNAVAIDAAGGMITFNGTSTNGGSAMEGNVFYAGYYVGAQPSYIFSGSGNYTQPFSGITVYSDTDLQIINNSAGDFITISGPIETAGGSSNTTATISTSGSEGGFILSGSNVLTAVNIASGFVSITGSSNFTNVNIAGSANLTLNTNTSLNSGNFVTINNTNAGNAQLSLVGGYTYALAAINLQGTGSNQNIVSVSSGNATVSAPISGSSNALHKTGSGTLTLSNAVNTYGGGTFLDSGYLAIASTTGTPLGSGSLTFSQSQSTTLQVSADYTLANPIVTGNGGVLSVADGITLTATGLISGSYGLYVGGGGTVYINNISSANTYTGGTTIENASLQISSSNQCGSGTIYASSVAGGSSILQALTNATVANPVNIDAGALTLSANSSATLTMSGLIAGSQAIYVSGPGILYMNNTASTYSGGTFVTQGTVSFGASGSADQGPFGTGAVTFSNETTLNFQASASLYNSIVLSSGFAVLKDNGNTATLNGLISGSGSLIKNGTGTLSITDAGNTYSGGTNILGGTLVVSSSCLGTGPVALSNASELSMQVASTIPNSMVLSSGTETISDNGNAITLAGRILGVGTLIKNGSGVLTISNADNNYGGGTTLVGGTVQVVGPATSTALPIFPVGTGKVVMDSTSTFLVTNASGGSNSQTDIVLGNAFSDTGSSSTTHIDVIACNAETVCSGVNTATFSGLMSFAGTLQLNNPASTYAGYIRLTGQGNAISNLYVDGGRLYIAYSSSISTGTAHLYLNGGELLFLNDFVASAPFTTVTPITALSSSITIDLAASGVNILNDMGHSVQIDSYITGVGNYDKQGSGVQALLNSSNDYTGGTTIEQGVLSIGSAQQINLGAGGIVLSGGTLFASELTVGSVNIPSSSSIAVSGSTSGVAAYEGKSLTIEAAITGSGTLTIGNTQVANPTGTVILSGTGSTFSGAVYLGSASYSATLSMGSMSPLGTPSLLLMQSGSELIATSSFSTADMPILLSTGSGSFSITSGNTLTVSGSISTSSTATGATPLAVNGGGTLVLQGNNSFVGDLNIAGNSTVQISSETNLGANQSTLFVQLQESTLHVTADVASQRKLSLQETGTVTVDGGATAFFSGGLSVSSGAILTKSGSGTLAILPEVSDSIPNLIVAFGSFIGNSVNLQNSSITVDGGASVSFSQSSPGTFNGEIAGAGSVYITKNIPLEFVSTGNTYTGNTVLEGTLMISQDVLSSTEGVLGAPSATLVGSGGNLQTIQSFSISRPITLNPLTNTSFSTNKNTVLEIVTDITGEGGLNKKGPGVLVLSGNCSYLGKTLVEGGELIVNGNIVSSGDPIVSPNSLLLGTGVVGPTDVLGVIKGGSVANPTGTLTIIGDLVLEPKSHFATTLSSGVVSLIDVSADVTIDSGVDYLLAAAPGSFNLSPQVVLQGNSISGQFTNIVGLDAYYVSSLLTYTGTQVLVELQERSIVELASGENTIQTANALDAAIDYNRSHVSYIITPQGVTPSSSPQLEQVIVSLEPFTTQSAMTHALNQLHPAQLKGLIITQENNAIQVREALSVRMQNILDVAGGCCSMSKRPATVWVQGFGDHLKQKNIHNHLGSLTGYFANTGGVALGMDGLFSKYFYAGGLGGYTNSHIHWKSGKGTGNISSGYAGLYFSAIGEMFYGNLSVIGSWSDYQVHRHIQYPGVNLTAKNHHGGRQLLSHADTGINYTYAGLVIRPFDNIDYISQSEYGYSEKNAGEWDLTVKKSHSIFIRNELGLQLSACFPLSNSKWTVSPKFSWVREIRIQGKSYQVDFSEGGAPFTIGGYFPDRNLFSPGLTVTGILCNDALTWDLYYDGSFGSGFQNNGYGTSIRYCF